MARIIMHIDLNAFFATAEEARHPEYRGRPLIVGGYGPRSVVSTASYEARKFGVHSAMPIGEAKRLCPSGIFLPCDFPYYEMMSQSFFAYLKRYSLIIEEASIDECYVDMTKPLYHLHDPVPYLRALQKGLYDEMKLKCSIGIAPTKFLAKMASDMKKPSGITIIRRRDIRKMIYPLPIESFYGIGKKSSPRLHEMGIQSIGDLAKRVSANDPGLEKLLGKFYETVKLWLQGYGNDKVDPTPFDPKSIGHSETFPYDTSNEEEIESLVMKLSREVSSGAQADKKKGKTVVLMIKDSNFKTYSKSVSFSEPTDSFDIIYEAARKLYERRFLGMMVRLVGVTLQNLINPKEETIQMSLWNYPEYEAMDKTKLLVDELNRKMAKPSLFLAKEMKKKNGDS